MTRREKEEKKFHSDLISALRQKPINKIWHICNSAFFLWILSACAFAIGGSYFTTKQQCLKEAEALNADAYAIIFEAKRRQRYYAISILEAKDAESISSSIGKYQFGFSDFKDRTDHDLILKINSLQPRVEGSKIGIDRLFNSRSNDIFLIVEIIKSQKINETNLIDIKEFIFEHFEELRNFSTKDSYNNLKNIYSFHYGHGLRVNCGARSIFQQMMFGSRKVLFLEERSIGYLDSGI